MATSWGPLHVLQAHLARDDGVADDAKDRKQGDAALARLLIGDELSSALTAASLDQLDLALAHEGLALERKPLSHLTLLSVKASKFEAWLGRKAANDEKAAQRTAAASLATQLAQLLHQVPIYVAVKELKRVSQLTALLVSLSVELKQPLRAVFPLKSFLRRFHQQGNTAVTSIHSSFFNLCLQAKCYSAASDILDQPLFEMHAGAGITAADFLGYAYYGGCLYVGQKKYQEAIEFFLSAVTAPALALSAFVVEAYKKLVLVSLIVRGDMPSLPKYTPFVVTRHLDMHCAPYNELSRAFSVDKSIEKLLTVVQNYTSTFTKDNNFGLVKQVIAAFKRRKLLQLPRTYVTIALGEMAKATDMGDDALEAEKQLLQLVESGSMSAVVDKQKQMVTFVLDDDSGEDELKQMLMMEKLQREMEKMLLVSAQLRAMDTDVVTSAKFQHRLAKDKDRRQRGPQGQAGGTDERTLLGGLGGPGADAMQWE